MEEMEEVVGEEKRLMKGMWWGDEEWEKEMKERRGGR